MSQVSPSTQIGEDPPAQCSAKIRKCDCDTGTAYGSVFEENWGTVPFNKRKRVKHCSDGEIAILYAAVKVSILTLIVLLILILATLIASKMYVCGERWREAMITRNASETCATSVACTY